MNHDRVICPHCHRSVPGVERIGATIAVRVSRSCVTFNNGTLYCPCGTTLVLLAGAIAEYAPPNRNPIETTLNALVEKLKAYLPVPNSPNSPTSSG